MNVTQQDVIKRIENKKYISFDIFETLLVRNVSTPEQVFDITENKLVRVNEKYTGFAEKRKKAASVAQKKSGKVETLFKEIYQEMDSDSDLQMNLELETEIEYLQANPFFDPILNYCKSMGKYVILTSDMYLSRENISRILRKNQIDYDALYLSSDIQKRKSSGQLFRYVIKDLNIAAKDIIHIGNNRKSDFFAPRLCGIDSIWYQYNPRYVKNINDSIAHTYIYNNKTKLDKQDWAKAGYTNFGPLLYGFSTWLHEKVIKEHIDQICFLARDGKIMMDAYSVLYDEPVTYVYASRRSLTVPMLTEACSFEDVCRIVPYVKREEKTCDFLHKIGIESTKLVKAAESLVGTLISRNDLFTEKGNALFELIETEMKENARNESEIAADYLSQIFTGKKVALVDIGWYGTMQNAIESFIHNKTDKCIQFKGYYIGYIQSVSHFYEGMDAEGYIFDDYRNRTGSNCIFGFNGLIESFFTTNHGSTKKYSLEDNTIKAILEDQEDIKEWLSDFQTGALMSVKELKSVLMGKKISADIAFSNLNKILLKPDAQDIETYGNIEFYDVYYEKLVNTEGLIKYFLNPKRFIFDYGKSNWKIGFLRKTIGISLLNYKKIYQFINKIKP